MLLSFSGPEDAADEIRWLLAHDREREKMAAAAREAIADRTFGNSARKLLKMLEDLQ